MIGSPIHSRKRMLSSLNANCIVVFVLLTSLFQIASAINDRVPSQISSAAASNPGYNCEGTSITGRMLKEVVQEYYHNNLWSYDVLSYMKRINDPNNEYTGPPFTKTYRLWPVDPQTKDYNQAIKKPFRVVFDGNFNIISVIVKNGPHVKECKSNERVSSHHNRYDYMCTGRRLTRAVLEKAATAACPNILTATSPRSALRYDGPPIKGASRQLYISPVSSQPGLNRNDNTGNGDYALVNSACKVVGAVSKTMLPMSGSKPGSKSGSQQSYAVCGSVKPLNAGIRWRFGIGY